MLLPMILPKAMSAFPRALAKMFTTSSGEDVPKATIVRPIKMFERPSFFAREADASTRNAPPFNRIAKPMMNKMRVNIYGYYNKFFGWSGFNFPYRVDA